MMRLLLPISLIGWGCNPIGDCAQKSAAPQGGDPVALSTEDGICLVGDYNKGRPTPRQLVALRRLCRALMEEYGIPGKNVFRHASVRQGHTDCPGKRFPFEAFKRSL